MFVVEQVAPKECNRDAQYAREEAFLPDVRPGKGEGSGSSTGWFRSPEVWCVCGAEALRREVVHTDGGGFTDGGGYTRGGGAPGTPKKPLP